MNLLKKIFGKNKKKMNNQDEQIERIGNYKSIYQGQKFQWIKNCPDEHFGMVAQLDDIDLDNNFEIFATFENKVRVHIDTLNSDFQMIQTQADILSRDGIMSIYQDPGLSEEIKAQLPPKAETTPQPGNTVSVVPIREHVTLTTKQMDTSIFGMFSLSPTKLKVDIDVKLPAMSLLKVMYSESADKEQFLNQVAEYVYGSITPESVKGSILQKLAQTKKNQAD